VKKYTLKNKYINMKLIVTSDLHLTDKPEDEYRFDFIKYLTNMIIKRKIDYLFILGDLTDEKDRHSAKLTNRIVSNFFCIADNCNIVILKGNHDYYTPEWPFFYFLQEHENIDFISNSPIHIKIDENTNCLALPHTRTPETDWKDLDTSKADYVFLHQTIEGSQSSNGFKLNGLSLNFLKTKYHNGQKWFSGDVHVPQKRGFVEYVGSPYHVHFGDNFKARHILI